MNDDERKTEPPLHLDLEFEEALRRFAQTDQAEVEPPKGKKPKAAKGATRLPSLCQQEQEPKNHKRGRDT